MEFIQYDHIAANGDAYLQAGNYDSAIISYRSALALMPENRDAAANTAYVRMYTALGDVYRLQGRWYQAKSCYALAIQNMPEDDGNSIYICFGYGQALLENGDVSGAAPYLLKAYKHRRELFDGQDGKYYACIATQVEEEQAREDARRREQQRVVREQQRPAALKAPETQGEAHTPEKKGLFSSLFKKSRRA